MVLWHVDNLKIACKDSFEVTKLLMYLIRIYRNKIVAHWGKKHNYLGMDLNFSEKGVFRVSMGPYINKIREDFPEEITSTAPSPHCNSLFKGETRKT